MLYLLHGLSTNETQWELIGLPESMDAFVETNKLPFIVVMPRVPDSDAQAKSPIHQVIPEELVPHIDQNYPTLTEREFRAIGGISRGASLSLRIGYEHREIFGKVGMHSLPMLVDESTFYAKALGKLDNAERPLLFLDSGNDDRDLAVARHFDIELTKLAIPHTWYMFSGYHDEIYWSEHLPIYLEWYAQGW
jgi:enterochelin esterase-like enzyme